MRLGRPTGRFLGQLLAEQSELLLLGTHVGL